MRSFCLAVLLLLPSASWAGKLDIDYYRPSPTKAFMWSAVVPGGGMFYLSDYERGDGIMRSAFLFLAIEGGLFLLAKNRADKGKDLALPLGALFCVKVFEFDMTIQKAEKLRHTSIILDELPG